MKQSNVSKTVKILSVYNRTDVAGESLRKIQPGINSYLEALCSYASLLTIERDINQIPFSMASLMCLVSQDIVSGFYFEK